MKVLIVLTTVLAVTLAQNYPIDESPRPYSFNYVAEGEEGSSSHSETADGTGTVRGSYTLTHIDGRNRIVEYIAGPEGFNANIRTNEPGTINANPADVIIESSAEGSELHYNQPKPEAALHYRQPKPATRTITTTTSTSGSGNTRFVLVPSDDPRARAYHGRN